MLGPFHVLALKYTQGHRSLWMASKSVITAASAEKPKGEEADNRSGHRCQVMLQQKLAGDVHEHAIESNTGSSTL